MIAIGLSVVGAVVLYATGSGDNAQFYAGVSVIGISFGAFMGVFPGFTADQFGAKNNSVNYGIMFIGFAAAGFFGPTVMKFGISYRRLLSEGISDRSSFKQWQVCPLCFVQNPCKAKKQIENKL